MEAQLEIGIAKRFQDLQQRFTGWRLHPLECVERVLTVYRIRDVLTRTCHEDGTSDLDDAPLLERATELGRVLFSQDADLLVVAKEWQES